MREPDDPLTRALAPPPDETAEARAARVLAEAEARRVSDAIDAALERERAAQKKERVMKMLLLGQSESGKSTTLKNMQMAYTPRAWAQERASWKAVIQLNLVRSVNTILDALSSPNPSSPSSDPAEPDLRVLRMRLSPLRQVEADLKARLGAGTGEVDPDAPPNARPGTKDVVVRSHRAWMEHLRPAAPDSDAATEVLAGCAEDVGALWREVQETARRRRLVGDSGEYFLDNAHRIAARAYEPSDDDVLRARIRTLGVQEHRLAFEHTHDTRGLAREWIIYDVGGARTQRAAWLPFFSTVHALLFLAPISAFDERLLEDPRVNRLEDSFLLWQAVCKSELLRGATIILFMNKCDVLQKKLERGVRVGRYMPSYAARANEVGAVAAYLRSKFKDILALGSPERVFYGFMTSVVDAEATARTLASVRDGILHAHLKDAAFVN